MTGKRVGRYQVWMGRRQWEEFTGMHGVTCERTWYLLPLPGGPGEYPDARVVRRTALGGRLRPVRGLGTGDPAFDRAFFVDPAPRRLLTGQLREAMLAKAVPLWSIRNGVLTTSYKGSPTAANLDPRAETIARIADLLVAGA